jgi:hypothetical protein
MKTSIHVNIRLLGSGQPPKDPESIVIMNQHLAMEKGGLLYMPVIDGNIYRRFIGRLYQGRWVAHHLLATHYITASMNPNKDLSTICFIDCCWDINIQELCPPY